MANCLSLGVPVSGERRSEGIAVLLCGLSQAPVPPILALVCRVPCICRLDLIRASVGVLIRASVGATSVGVPIRASVGVLIRASVGVLIRASVGAS